MSRQNTTYRAALVGCGRIGTTVDDEVRGRPNVQLPLSHAAGYEATDRVELVAATGQEVCLGWLLSHLRDGARVELPVENRQFRVDPDNW